MMCVETHVIQTSLSIAWLSSNSDHMQTMVLYNKIHVIQTSLSIAWLSSNSDHMQTMVLYMYIKTEETRRAQVGNGGIKLFEGA
jgi:hypothetical protein